VHVKHIFRELNFFVDVLANIGCGGCFSSIYYKHCPTQMEAYLLAERNEVTFNYFIVSFSS